MYRLIQTGSGGGGGGVSTVFCIQLPRQIQAIANLMLDEIGTSLFLYMRAGVCEYFRLPLVSDPFH